MARWKIKGQLCHFQKQRRPYARTQMPQIHRRQPKPNTTVMLAVWWAHHPPKSSLHSLAWAMSLPLNPPRQSHRDEIIIIFFKKSLFKQLKCLASCCQESCHHGKEKEKVPKLVLNLFQELSIFLEAPREQMLSGGWQDAVLEREWLQADWWWPVGATFRGWHLRQAVGSLEWGQNATPMGWWKRAKISQKTQSKIHTTGLCFYF